MKYSNLYALGCGVVLYGVGMLQHVTSATAWAFIAVGVVVAVVAAAVDIATVVRERRRLEKEAASVARKSAEEMGAEIMAAMRLPIQVSFTIPPNSRLFMARAAVRLRVSPEEIVRRAVTSYLDRHGAQEEQR